MVPAASGLSDSKSVMTALTGLSTLVLNIPGRNISILQGELMGLVVGLLMASKNTQFNILHSDHLNSVRFIQDVRMKMGSAINLRSTNARSYYQWIADLAIHTCTMVVHVKSHTNEEDIESRLNAEADHYASKAQGVKHIIPLAPILTFTMDDYAFFRNGDGWIKSNIRIFIDHFMAKQMAKALSHTYHYRMDTWLYDTHFSNITPY
jgi:hypothetical protein